MVADRNGCATERRKELSRWSNAHSRCRDAVTAKEKQAGNLFVADQAAPGRVVARPRVRLETYTFHVRPKSASYLVEVELVAVQRGRIRFLLEQQE